MNVTNGYLFSGPTDPLTFSKLNLLGSPTVSLGAGEVTPANMNPSGIGYATGAGGAVTQATGKATSFSLNAACGALTTAADALNAATIVSATWSNTLIAATDVMIVNHKSGGTLGAYTINVSCGAGSATLTLRNNTAGNLSEALVISFALIKAVIS